MRPPRQARIQTRARVHLAVDFSWGARLAAAHHEQGTNPAVPVPLEGASSSILGDPATSVFVVGAGFARKRPESPPNGLGAFGRPNGRGRGPVTSAITSAARWMASREMSLGKREK